MSNDKLRVKSIKNCINSGRFIVSWNEETYHSCPLTGNDIDIIVSRTLKLYFDHDGNTIKVSYFSDGDLKWKHDKSSDKFEIIELKTLKKLVDIEKKHNSRAVSGSMPIVYIQKMLLETIGSIIERNKKINFKGLKNK